MSLFSKDEQLYYVLGASERTFSLQDTCGMCLGAQQ